MPWFIPIGIAAIYALGKITVAGQPKELYRGMPSTTPTSAANGGNIFQFLFNAVKMTPVVDPNNEIEMMAATYAKQQLRLNEGVKYVIYKDSRGFPTGGIGHLLTPLEKASYKVGDKISQATVDKWFNADFNKAFTAAKSQARELNKFTVTMIAALTEVNFQLGTGWRSNFANTWKDLKAGKVDSAIARLKAAAWYRQTPNRVSNFIGAIVNSYT